MNIRTFAWFAVFLVVAGVGGWYLFSQSQIEPINVSTSNDDPLSESLIHDLRVPPAGANARAELARRLSISTSSVTILEAREVNWSDSCLGLGGANESCLRVITPGYYVLMRGTGRTEYRYRTNSDGTSVRFESSGVVSENEKG